MGPALCLILDGNWRKTGIMSVFLHCLEQMKKKIPFLVVLSEASPTLPIGSGLLSLASKSVTCDRVKLQGEQRWALTQPRGQPHGCGIWCVQRVMGLPWCLPALTAVKSNSGWPVVPSLHKKSHYFSPWIYIFKNFSPITNNCALGSYLSGRKLEYLLKCKCCFRKIRTSTAGVREGRWVCFGVVGDCGFNM